MMNPLPIAGSADAALACLIDQRWAEIAAKAGVNLTGFDATAPLAERLAWARGQGLSPTAILSRYSSDMQHSTQSQVLDCVEFAAWHGLYTPAEFVCVDEGVSGRKTRRDGLDRVKAILGNRHATTLLVFKVSRLFRIAYKGYAFFQEEIVEKGLRAISISQGIDTADQKTWKSLAYLHGLMDEMLLTTIADHVRSGIKRLFQAGFVTGALPVGYQAVEVPGAPPTNRGRPRTVPRVSPEVARLIRQHFAWIADGMPIKEGWRRWVKANGPHDPRSKKGHMSYASYRRMLANPRYTGLWAFGRRRNTWSSSRDYIRQIPQAETEVVIFRCEELRIVEDTLFAAVQQRLAELKTGPRGPKRRKEIHLWDLVTEFFWCPHCDVRYYQAGANGHGMRCKHGDLCPCQSIVRRKDAVRAICSKLTELLQQDAPLLEQVCVRAEAIDARGDESLIAEIKKCEQRLASLDSRIRDLLDLVGQGSDKDRTETKARVQQAQTQRTQELTALARLQKARTAAAQPLTQERARAMLTDLTGLLEDAGAGRLGEDVVYRARAIFARLTGGRIFVHVEPRPGRKRTVVRGTFQPQLIATLQEQAELPSIGTTAPLAPVHVWLRPPPRVELLAERVHQLLDVEKVSYREAAAILVREGYRVNSGNLWYSYRRYYEMRGLEVPPRPYNNGRPRRSVG